MANQLFGGFLYTDAGVAIVGATADLFDRNTTTPVRATTTTDASGYWTISHATEGRFDVRITNGTSIRWRKYDNEEQLTTLEIANLRLRNPADTFDYDVVPGAITADRQLNLPVITGTDTVAVLTLAQTLSSKTLSAPTITASDWANATHTHVSAATGGAISVGVTRAGGNTTEATTTSTTVVDLITTSSLTIAVSVPVMAVVSARKTSGAVASVRIRFKLNATAITTSDLNISSTTNADQSGYGMALFTYGLASYLRAGRLGSDSANGVFGGQNFQVDMPTATLTDVIFQGLTGDALVTEGMDDMHVYTHAVS